MQNGLIFRQYGPTKYVFIYVHGNGLVNPYRAPRYHHSAEIK